MQTQRWQRRLFGAVISATLLLLSCALFDVYSTKAAAYFVYGCLVVFFTLTTFGFVVSTVYHKINRTKAPKKLWK
jgi:ABC-type polysaccharide/polyol phosphate export permease